MAKAKENTPESITIQGVDVGAMEVCILGESPLIFNRMAEKAKRELLLPKGKKTAADRAQSIKHDPIAEFRASVYQRKGDGPTRLIFPAPAFKGAMASAALETPGAKKAQIGRLAWVEIVRKQHFVPRRSHDEPSRQGLHEFADRRRHTRMQ